MPNVTISHALHAQIQHAARLLGHTQQALVADILEAELACARAAHAAGASLIVRYMAHPDYAPIPLQERTSILISAAHHRAATEIATWMTAERGGRLLFAGQFIQALLWTVLVPIVDGERIPPPPPLRPGSATTAIPDALYDQFCDLARQWGHSYQDTYLYLLEVGLAAVAAQGPAVLAPYPNATARHLTRTVQVPRRHEAALQQLMAAADRTKSQVVQAILRYALAHATLPPHAPRTLAIPADLYAQLSDHAGRCVPPQVIDVFVAEILVQVAAVRPCYTTPWMHNPSAQRDGGTPMADPAMMSAAITGLVSLFSAYTTYKTALATAQQDQQPAPEKSTDAAKGEQVAQVVETSITTYGAEEDQLALRGYQKNPQKFASALIDTLAVLAEQHPPLRAAPRSSGGQVAIGTYIAQADRNSSVSMHISHPSTKPDNK